MCSSYIYSRLNVHIFSHTTGIIIFSLLPSMKNEITFSVEIFVIEGKYSNVYLAHTDDYSVILEIRCDYTYKVPGFLQVVIMTCNHEIMMVFVIAFLALTLL